MGSGPVGRGAHGGRELLRGQNVFPGRKGGFEWLLPVSGQDLTSVPFFPLSKILILQRIELFKERARWCLWRTHAPDAKTSRPCPRLADGLQRFVQNFPVRLGSCHRGHQVAFHGAWMSWVAFFTAKKSIFRNRLQQQ